MLHFFHFVKKVSMRKLINGKNAARFPFWRERGTASRWLVVESRMLYVNPWDMLLLTFL